MRLFLLASFFLTTPLLFTFTILYLLSLSYQKNNDHLARALFGPARTVAYAALPGTQNDIFGFVTQKDVRVESVRTFFARYHSPLEPYAEHIIKAADFYGITHRLVPAIAMQESNLCKKAPKDSHNCWGYGIYAGRVKRFKNFEEAIDAVTRTLAVNYKRQGLETPEQIMTRYTPANTNNWAQKITFFMNQLQ